MNVVLCKQFFLFFGGIGFMGQFDDFGPGNNQGVIVQGFFSPAFAVADSVESISQGAGFFAATAAQAGR